MAGIDDGINGAGEQPGIGFGMAAGGMPGGEGQGAMREGPQEATGADVRGDGEAGGTGAHMAGEGAVRGVTGGVAADAQGAGDGWPQPAQPIPQPRPQARPQAGAAVARRGGRRWPLVAGGFAAGALAMALGMGVAPAVSGGIRSLAGGDAPGRAVWDEERPNPRTSSGRASLGDGATPSEVAARCLPSVVSVHVEGRSSSGIGSGVVMDDEGHVVTNSHVVKGMEGIVVVTGDGDEFAATVRGLDDSSDLAVLDVDWGDEGFEPIEWGDSDALEVGDWVMTIGSPYGLDQSVSSGIVSALARNQMMDSWDGYRIYAHLIQTDAAINTGNSGGALVNSRGQLVGINSMLASSSGSSAGVGFAIPSNYALRVATQIVEGKEVEHAYIGGRFGDVSRLDSGGGDYVQGAYVAEAIEGEPAAEAGIREGDVITRVGDERVTSASGLIMAVRSHEPGEEVGVTVVRSGEELELEVTLGSDLGKGLYDEDGQRIDGQQQDPYGQGWGYPYGQGQGYGQGWGWGWQDPQGIIDELLGQPGDMG